MRSQKYRTEPHNRYWWYRLADTDYMPPVFARLNDGEWRLMEEWFDETGKRFESPGELSVPGISVLAGLLGGNGICATVQLGHYVGYSTLLLGKL